MFRATVAAKAKKIALNDNVNVLRKSLNEFPAFGDRRAAFECKVRSPLFRQLKQFAQHPTDPKVFFHADGVKTEFCLCFIAEATAPVRRKLGERWHSSFFRGFGDSLHTPGNPCRGISEILEELSLVGGLEALTKGGQHMAVHMALTNAFGYEVAGRRVAVTNALGSIPVSWSGYGYDANGNQIYFTNALNVVTTNVFDALNRQVQVFYPDGTKTSTAYDAATRFREVRETG